MKEKECENIMQQDIAPNYVYILECKDKTLYTGWTNDLSRRIKAHNAQKGAKYTKYRIPVKLVYYEEFDDKSSALKREHAIKKLSRLQKCQLIASYSAKEEFIEEKNAKV